MSGVDAVALFPPISLFDKVHQCNFVASVLCIITVPSYCVGKIARVFHLS